MLLPAVHKTWSVIAMRLREQHDTLVSQHTKLQSDASVSLLSLGASNAKDAKENSLARLNNFQDVNNTSSSNDSTRKLFLFPRLLDLCCLLQEVCSEFVLHK